MAAWCDELPFVLGWTEPGFMRRTSHALLTGGRVWLVDPLDAAGVDERLRLLGDPVGVIQLLDRHDRDCSRFAARHGVPLHRVPLETMPGTPFEVWPVLDRRRWREVALWWPEEAVLVCADALGTAPYFLAPGEALGVHPLLRLRPPSSPSDRRGSDPATSSVDTGRESTGNRRRSHCTRRLRPRARGYPGT